MGETAKLHSELEALVGSTIHDRYEVESLLGAGGMGAVFKARHTGLQRGVAIKVLHPEIGRDEAVSKRFDREAHSASRLDHPNCVRISDFGTTDSGTKYLVMELLDGGDLDAQLDRPWSAIEAIATIEQVLRGLEHAHHVGIVHRDLKPENIFLTQDFRGEPVVKIVDFGIAKLLDERGSEKLTRQGIVFGTPRYMSPEQAAGGKIDERSDLYAVGLILYQLVAGRPPFVSDDAGQLLRMQIMAPPPPLPDSVPPALAKVIETLLEKSKMDRYASATEVLDALAQARPTIGVSPVPAPATSGSAWQPAPAPATSGATLLAATTPTAILAAAPSSGVSAAIGSHPGVGQPTSPSMPLTAEPRPSSSPAWLPVALAGVALLLVLSGVGLLMSSLDGDEQPAEPAASPAASPPTNPPTNPPPEAATTEGPPTNPIAPTPTRAHPSKKPKKQADAAARGGLDPRPAERDREAAAEQQKLRDEAAKREADKREADKREADKREADKREAEQRKADKREPQDKDKGKGKGRGKPV